MHVIIGLTQRCLPYSISKLKKGVPRAIKGCLIKWEIRTTNADAIWSLRKLLQLNAIWPKAYCSPNPRNVLISLKDRIFEMRLSERRIFVDILRAQAFMSYVGTTSGSWLSSKLEKNQHNFPLNHTATDLSLMSAVWGRDIREGTLELSIKSRSTTNHENLFLFYNRVDNLGGIYLLPKEPWCLEVECVKEFAALLVKKTR